MGGCKFWMAFANTSCQWGQIFFYLHLYSCRPRTLLWLLFFYSYLNCRSNYSLNGYGHGFLRIRASLGANIFLRSYCNYQSIFCHPLYWRILYSEYEEDSPLIMQP